MDYKKDYYSILGVDENATREVLRDAYRRLAKLHHPDRNQGNPEAEERFKAINEAYEILSNEITRHVYDSHRTKNKKEESNTHHSHKPFTTTKTRTFTATREKRIYVHGFIEVKFQGDPELSDTYLRQWEQRFKIIPTETLVTITSSTIYKDGPPKEFQLGYSTSELFKTPLKQPVTCKVITGDHEEYYQLDLYDIRVKDPRLKDITRHDQFSFGTLEGTLYGYVLHQYKEEVTEEYTEYFGPTGQVETKTESGDTYTRQQFYAANGSTYWTEWKRSYHTPQNFPKSFARSTDDSALASWLLVLFIIVAVWPKILLVILPLIAGLLLLALLGWVLSAFNSLLPWLSRIAIAMIIFFAIRSLFNPSGSNATRATSSRGIDSVKSEKAVVRGQNDQADTIIKHTLAWEDRDSSRYSIQLSISTSALHNSIAAHNQMDYQRFAMQGIGAVYRTMLENDNKHLDRIAFAFDSLAQSNSLDEQKKASMVVSCIQSIPYSLVVDGACTSNYNDEFVRQYLANCESDCCKGFSKFGVQSPVEFIGDLKGDCDTRALLLYDVLRKLGYNVALLVSNYYKHAVIAVRLNGVQTKGPVSIRINEEPYYLWETTSKGFGPGELPVSISNLNHWEIALIQ